MVRATQSLIKEGRPKSALMPLCSHWLLGQHIKQSLDRKVAAKSGSLIIMTPSSLKYLCKYYVEMNIYLLSVVCILFQFPVFSLSV